jgi:hypothetical protein
VSASSFTGCNKSLYWFGPEWIRAWYFENYKNDPMGMQRLALQEDIAQLIADRLWDVPESYKPVGLIVRVIGDHFCEKIRGVKRQSPTITTQVRGFIREEFLTMFYKHIKEWA